MSQRKKVDAVTAKREISKRLEKASMLQRSFIVGAFFSSLTAGFFAAEAVEEDSRPAYNLTVLGVCAGLAAASSIETGLSRRASLDIISGFRRERSGLNIGDMTISREVSNEPLQYYLASTAGTLASAGTGNVVNSLIEAEPGRDVSSMVVAGLVAAGIAYAGWTEAGRAAQQRTAIYQQRIDTINGAPGF